MACACAFSDAGWTAISDRVSRAEIGTVAWFRLSSVASYSSWFSISCDVSVSSSRHTDSFFSILVVVVSFVWLQVAFR